MALDPSMTHHYSVAQIVELHSGLEKVKDDAGRCNKSLAMLKIEQENAKTDGPPKVPQQEKMA